MILNDEQLANLTAQVKFCEEGQYALIGLNLNDAHGLLDTIADLKRQVAERDALPAFVTSVPDPLHRTMCTAMATEMATQQTFYTKEEHERIVQEQVDRAVLAESEAIADRWNGFTKSRLPFEKWLFDRLAANQAKVKVKETK